MPRRFLSQSLASFSLALVLSSLAVGQSFQLGESLSELKLGDFDGPTKRSSLPTAAALSEPGALAEYIDKSLREEGRCRLPAGVIETDRTIVLSRVAGGVIEGAGPPSTTADSKNGWRTHPDVIHGTTLVVATDPSVPVIALKPTMGVELRNFGIETSGVGISLPHVTGWGSAHTYLHRITFLGCEIGFRAGQKTSDHNAADVTFNSCQFSRCEVGLQVNHLQGVNYQFSGQNWFGYCDRAVVFNNGGCSHLQNLCGYGVGTWLTIRGGGPNLMPMRITHLYSDRSNTDTPPVIVDASEANDQVRVLVDGVKVTQQGAYDKEHYPDHVYYRLPRRDDIRKKSTIRVRDNDLNNYPWGGIYEPKVVPEAK